MILERQVIGQQAIVVSLLQELFARIRILNDKVFCSNSFDLLIVCNRLFNVHDFGEFICVGIAHK